MLEPEQFDQLMRDLIHSDRLTADVREYARLEFDRGIQYHIDYVGRLGMSGESVLDAGCGVGNWSLALSKYFDKVTALEFNPDRLDCTRLVAKAAELDIEFVLGSIENLSFSDATFDAVFCNGVIFLTDWRKSLSELQRVLKPGGTLYVTFNDLAWWDHLIHDRGAGEPHLLPMSCEVLANQFYDTLSHLTRSALDDESVKIAVVRAVILAAINPVKSSVFRLVRTLWELRKLLRKLFSGTSSSTNLTEVFQQLVVIEAGVKRIFLYGTEVQKKFVITDAILFLAGKPLRDTRYGGFCINSQCMSEAIKAHGLRVIGTAPEGQLVVDASQPPPTSIYKQKWGVIETLAIKSNGVRECPSVNYFRENARHAPYKFSNFISAEVLPNIISPNQVEAALSRHYLLAANEMDHQSAFRLLIADLEREAEDEEELFEAIYRFVQDVVFHHPLVQMIKSDGNAQLDSFSTLLSGIGRCGHVAACACDFYQAAGYEARITQLYKHICCEVLVNDRWLVVDADAFKGGVYPRNNRGDWATLDDLRASPFLLDKLPATGLQLSPSAPWSRSLSGAPVRGYTDVGLAWQRPYMSYLYFGVNPGCPAVPPIISVRRLDNDQLQLTAKDIAADILQVRIAIGTDMRGWCYDDVPNADYLHCPVSDVALLELTSQELETGVIVTVPEQTLYVNVFGLNNYQLKNQGIWIWPAPEIVVTI